MCLQELVKVMECHRSSTAQTVVPVFYCLDPSHVHNLSGSFGRAFLDTLQRNSTDKSKALSYRTALREAAAISPTFLPDARNESKVIEDIVRHVTSLLDSTDLFVAEHPVGVDSRVQDLIQLINNRKSDDVLVIAICGMAGIGKTTIAKALYNQISSNFDVKKFVPNIKGRMKDSVTLKQVLRYFLGEKVKRKVLLILDNVRSERELEVLPVTLECFGPGSIIIITTRGVKHDRFHEIGVNHIYKVKEMDYNECVELFSWRVFKKVTPERSFSRLINYAMEYCDGLPFALVAIGSVLLERSIEEWESVLQRLERFHLQDVWQILKQSVDSLEYYEKKIFLEIAYLGHLFIGMDLNDICQILQDAGHGSLMDPRTLQALEDHSLVWFDEDKLCMHRLLQQIGREMYMKESWIRPKIF